MDEQTFVGLKDIYGLLSLAIAMIFVVASLHDYRSNKEFPKLNRLLGIAILGWSAYIALFSEPFNPVDDWIITVPLIYIALINHNEKHSILSPSTFTILYVAMGIIATISIYLLREGEVDFSLILDAGFFYTLPGFLFSSFIILGALLFFNSNLDYNLLNTQYKLSILLKFPFVASSVILLYPILFYFGNATLTEPSVYEGSPLAGLGIDFYLYSTIILSLSIICKIWLTIYHDLNDE